MKKIYTKENLEAFILTYNRAGMLKESLTSLLNQSVGKILITIMDNGSTDDTELVIAEMMKLYPQVHYFKQPENITQIENFKKAIELATHDYAMFFHDDDILHPDYFKYALKAINRYQNVGIISSGNRGEGFPTNLDWKKASTKYDFCKDKDTFAQYLYRMRRFSYSNTIYKTQNVKDFKDWASLDKFGKIYDKIFVIDTMKDDDSAVYFRDKKLLRYRIHAGQDTAHTATGPFYDEIIEYSKFYKPFMTINKYSQFMWQLENFRQLKDAYNWGGDKTLSLKEFIEKADKQGASCKFTELLIGKYGKFWFFINKILRKIFKSSFKVKYL